MSLTIEAGKFYKTKSGIKATILGRIPGKDIAVGYVTTLCDGVISGSWKVFEGENRENDSLLDLVSPWVDPPVVDWRNIAPGILAVALSQEYILMGYLRADLVQLGGNWKHFGKDLPPHIAAPLPRHLMAFSGDWRDSLVIRPGYEKQHITQAVHDVKKREAALSSEHPDHTPGPWREGTVGGIVADAPTGFDDDDNMRAYGGHLVCESVWTKGNRSLIAAAPELYEACKVAMKVLHNRFTAEEVEAKSMLHSAVCSAEGIPF